MKKCFWIGMCCAAVMMVGCGSSSSSSTTVGSSGWTVVASSGETVSGTDFIGSDQRNLLATGGVTQNQISGYYDIQFLSSNSNVGWAVGNLGEVLKTTNGGSNASLLAFDGSDSILRGVFPMTENKVWIVGRDSVNDGASIFATTDGGTTWSVQLNTKQEYPNVIGGGERSEYNQDRINSVVFLDENTGFAAGGLGDNSNVILKTTDGTNWTSVYRDYTVGTDDELHKIFFVDSTTGYAVGNQGAIVKTTNGGTSWTVQASGVTADLLDVICSSGDRCLTVGDSGTILGTLDGGTTWTSITSGTTQDLAAIEGAGDKAWVGGYNGTILYSSNGGTTWTSQTTNTTYPIQDIYMVSETVGFAVASGNATNTGAVLATISGGQ
ncbi:MAG: hypothetical protein HY540_02520 [Deltaproteobacteria bacterium]|nr:hypothetical protein [Deltaproteobacteria bacterium]